MIFVILGCAPFEQKMDKLKIHIKKTIFLMGDPTFFEREYAWFTHIRIVFSITFT